MSNSPSQQSTRSVKWFNMINRIHICQRMHSGKKGLNHGCWRRYNNSYDTVGGASYWQIHRGYQDGSNFK